MCVGFGPLYFQENVHQQKVLMKNEQPKAKTYKIIFTLRGIFVSKIRRSNCPAPALEIAAQSKNHKEDQSFTIEEAKTLLALTKLGTRWNA